MNEHNCQECGIRQRVDGLTRLGDREQALAIVVETCTKCTQHPNADAIRGVAQYIGMEMTDNWISRADE